MKEVDLTIEEKSYKYLELVLEPFVRTLKKKVPQLSSIYSNKELLERYMKKFYEYSKDTLENLLLQEDEFYKLLIEVGRDKELLIHSLKEIELKTVIDCATPDTLADSLVLIGKEYVDFIIDDLRKRVIWLVSEYNDLNFDKQYEIKDIEGNLINDTDKRCNNNI